MHAETKGALITNGANLASELLKEVLVRREENKMMERQAEMEKELAETRARANQPRGGGSVVADPSGNGGEQAASSGGQQPAQQEFRSPSEQPAQQEPEDVTEALGRASQMAREYDDLLATAQEREDCEMCRAIIEEARGLPLPQQQKVLPELQDFIEMAETNPDADELRAKLQQSEHLMELVQRINS